MLLRQCTYTYKSNKKYALSLIMCSLEAFYILHIQML